MERTDYVRKAKNLILTAARTTALVIVPLAAAVSAQASTSYDIDTTHTVSVSGLPTGSPTCAVSGSGGASPSGSCSVGDSPFTNTSLGLNGVSFDTTSPMNFTTSSGSTFALDLTVSASGAFFANLPAVMPVHWDFTLTPTNAAVTSWTLVFTLLNTSSGSTSIGSVTETWNGSDTTFQTFSGADAFSPSVTTGFTSLKETVALVVNGTAFNDGSVAINVPAGSSFDFGTPEPASVGLMASGLAFLGLLIRRRRKA